MDYKKFNDKYVLRLEKGEEVVESLKKFAKKEDIKLAKVSGIGAVNKATIGLFLTKEKRYFSKELTGDMEIIALNGSISTMDKEVYLHLHIALGNEDFDIRGGHLNSAEISATGELIIELLDGEVDRKLDEDLGLNLFKLD